MSMVDNLIEGVTKGLINRLGINPQDIKNGFAGVIRDAAAVKNEVFAAKAGFSNVTADFKRQLDRIETQNVEIIRRLKAEVTNDEHQIKRIGNG